MKKLLGSVIVLVLLCLIVPVSAEAATEYVGYDEAVLQLRQQLVERQTTAVVYLQSDYDIGTVDLLDMLEEAMAHTGNPKEGDYIRANMSGCTYSVTTTVTEGVYCHTCIFTPNWLATAQQEAEVDAAVDALLAELDLWNVTDYEKIKGTYDWITENVQYDFDNVDDETYLLKHATYSAIIQKNTVCQGYASLYYRLLLELGVDCRYISGYADDEHHGWNIVCLDGKYYNCDPTWDRDLMGHYRYFLCTQANFATHARDSRYDTADFHNQHPMALTPYIFNVTASGTVNSNIAWVLDGDTGTLTVAGTGPIPSYRYSYAPWYNYRESVKKIVVGEGITEVGERAFYWCTNCTEVDLPDSLIAIREYGFNNLRALQYITLPQNLEILEFCAFSECAALKEITLPDSVHTVGSSCFSNCAALATAKLSAGMKTIPSSMFFNDGNLRTVDLPEGITYIDDTAFHSCGLYVVHLPSTLTSMGTSVFSGCSSMHTFTVEAGNPSYKAENGILFTADGKTLLCYPAGKYGNYSVPEGTEIIARGAFRSARYLMGITFPSTLKEIGGYSFSYCTNLTKVTFPKNVTRICDSAFRSCTSLWDITFENDSVTIESGGVFAECDNLVSISLPSKISEIPGYLFYGCAKLKYVTIPSTASQIGSSAFLDCDSLVSITVPGSVKSVGQQAFDFCNKLETIVFEEGLQTLGWISIRNCPKLKKVVLPDSLTRIEQPSNASSRMFDDCPNVVLYVNCGTFGYNYAISRGLSYSASHPQSTRVVQPTCTEDGYTVYGCACGLYGTKSNFVAATGHDYVSYTVEPDCYSYGYTYYSCQNCWDYYETDYVEPRHSFGDWYVICEATCESDGERERYCSWCGYWELDSIPPTGHSYAMDVTSATCTTDGYTTYTCTACGYGFVDDWVLAYGHDCVTYDYVAASCTEDGYSGDEICQSCGETVTPGQVIPALGHAYKSTYTEPTCTEAGYVTHVCTNCGDTYADGHEDPTGHSYTPVVTPPTCTAQGYTTHTCDACGDSYVDAYTDPADHTPGEAVMENEGAHGSHELVIYCTACGEELSREYCDGYLPGDINGDGAVNNKDVTRLFQYLSDYDVEVVEEALDVNGDGSINNKDLTRLFQYLSDYDVELC